MLEVLIPNPSLELRNSDAKMLFWENLGRKSKSCSFCLKIGTHGILEVLIPNPGLEFRNLGRKS